MTEKIIAWLDSTALHDWIIGGTYIWPTMETIHFIGLCLFMGSLLIVDLGLMGVIRNLAPKVSHLLLKLVLFGFALNLITGILFVFGDPGRYFINIGFQIKVALMVLAAINAVWYMRRIAPKVEVLDTFTPYTETKVVGALSLILWFGVLMCGRMIPYVGTG